MSDSHTPKSARRRFVYIGIVCIIAIGPFAPKVGIEWAAERAAEREIAQLVAEDSSEQSFALAATLHVHNAYVVTQQDPQPGILTALRPYLSNSLLPEVLRVEPGAIDILELEGLCDSAARTLAYLLNRSGFDAAQLNIVGPQMGHTVVEAQSVTRSYMLDPERGIAPILDGRVLSPTEAQASAADRNIWQPLSETSLFWDRYPSFGDAVFARQGAGLKFMATISLLPGEELVIGRVDGSSSDVVHVGARNGLSPFFSYLGSRYDRSWIRELHFDQSTTVHITLVEDLDPRFLNIDPKPDINGRTLSVRIGPRDSLRFTDGDARRNLLKLRSFQDVDQIHFVADR